MPRKNESFATLLVLAPWWVSMTLGVAAFIVLRYILPVNLETDPAISIWAVASRNAAPFLAGIFFFLSGIAFWRRRSSSALVERQSNLDSLKLISWKEFEWMVAEAYRRSGYSVEESIGCGADGGVDLILYKDGRKFLVQCKRWKTASVGAPVVREMFGILMDQGADEFIIVASGHFTTEAKEFARNKPIQLVDGQGLLKLLSEVQISQNIAESNPKALQPHEISESQSSVSFTRTPTQERSRITSMPAQSINCPECGAQMVERVAKRGKNIGGSFWGCSQYPKCKGIRQLV